MRTSWKHGFYRTKCNFARAIHLHDIINAMFFLLPCASCVFRFLRGPAFQSVAIKLQTARFLNFTRNPKSKHADVAYYPPTANARAMFFCLVGSVNLNFQKVRQRQRRLLVGVVNLPEVRVAVLWVRPRKLSPRKFPSVQEVPSEDASRYRSQTPASSTRQRHSQVDSCSFHCALHYCSEE